MRDEFRVTLSASCSARTIRSSKRASRSSLAVAAALSIGLCQPSLAQQPPSADGGATLFQNVRIFDGRNTTLSAASNVLVRGNKIETISTQPIAVDRRADTRIIDGGGRTLMPGLSDDSTGLTTLGILLLAAGAILMVLKIIRRNQNTPL